LLLLHVSDTHLGKRQYNLESRENDLYEVFSQLVDLAIEERVDVVVHSGDLFDVNNPSNEAEMIAIRELSRLRDKGIPFIGIPGDHDTPKRRGLGRSVTVHDMLQTLGLIKVPELSEPIEVKGVTIYGKRHVPLLSEDSRTEFQNALRSLKPKGKSVLVLHQGIKELLPFDYAYQMSFSDIPMEITYAALGHFHDRLVMRRENGSVVAIAGSPDIIDEREIEGYKRNGKGAWLVDLSKDEPSVTGLNVKLRPQDVIEVNTSSFEQDIIQKAPKPVGSKLPVLHLILKGEPIKKDVLMKKIASLEGEVAEKIRIYKDNTYILSEGFKDVSVVKGSLNDLILEYLIKREGYSPEDAKLILSLIASDDEEEMKSILAKFAGLEK
jgi:DNA repair exonuclease SbcCD nuclease subunit